jgi:hypothetical protein
VLGSKLALDFFWIKGGLIEENYLASVASRGLLFTPANTMPSSCKDIRLWLSSMAPSSTKVTLPRKL